MSRKFNRTLQVNTKVIEILNDPNTVNLLARKIIRKKPKYLPWLLWKGLLLIVLAPAAKERPNQHAKESAKLTESRHGDW
jgi:hypothetical protein